MQRRTLLTGLAALAGTVGTRRLLAQDKAPSATGAGSCKLITQDVRGPFDVTQYVERSDLFTQRGQVRRLDLCRAGTRHRFPVFGTPSAPPHEARIGDPFLSTEGSVAQAFFPVPLL